MPTAALAASLALLGWYNHYAFGKATGPYGNDGLEVQVNNLVVFFGLHFDQSQGIFLQQPLWLLGLIGLGPMWCASRRRFLWWILMYAATIVPNTLHPNWYGGYSFVGRFGSTSVRSRSQGGEKLVFAQSAIWATPWVCRSMGLPRN
ncbi:MAG TPA: hypothetical protein VG826_34250 [Pirellulales bacterium]|nr:hypothetical protein [Pirellulales bacterium]